MESEEGDEFSDSEELTSDEELQAELLRGGLKPGLIARNAPKRTYTNNVLGLREKLAFLKTRELDWLERMDITAPLASSSAGTEEEQNDDDTANPEDDFKREMNFLEQAQSTALIGLKKLEELGVPTQRPRDYYAEMVKTDDHMRKVRENLLSKQKVLEHKEKARKLRELKKYGKKVQQEILQKRREDKKASLEAVKKFRKGRGRKPEFLKKAGEEEDDGFPVATERESAGTPAKGGPTRGRQQQHRKSKKREIKDAKFGRGGRKKWRKSNTASSSADMSQFRSAKPPPPRAEGGRRLARAGKKSGKKPVRLGKSRRQKMKTTR